VTLLNQWQHPDLLIALFFPRPKSSDRFYPALAPVAITKGYKLGNFSTVDIYFHSSGGWKFKIQWQHGWILAKAFFFWQKAAHFLRYLTRGKRVLSEVSFISALILFRRALPSRPIHLPKFHLLIPSHWD
jgi:hypothetical protein